MRCPPSSVPPQRPFFPLQLAVKAGGTANDGSFDYPTVTDGLNGVKFIHAVIDSAAQDSAWVEL